MEELKQQIIDLCNNSGLPLEAILFVTKDVWRDVEDTIRILNNKQSIKVKDDKQQVEETKQEEETE